MKSLEIYERVISSKMFDDQTGANGQNSGTTEGGDGPRLGGGTGK